MTVYVDQARNPLGRMIMCHMVSDNISELFEMAQRIGMQARWFQPRSFPHFDVSVSRRTLALQYGAQVMSRREIALFMRSYRLRLTQDQKEKGLLEHLSRSPSFAIAKAGYR